MQITAPGRAMGGRFATPLQQRERAFGNRPASTLDPLRAYELAGDVSGQRAKVVAEAVHENSGDFLADFADPDELHDVFASEGWEGTSELYPLSRGPTP